MRVSATIAGVFTLVASLAVSRLAHADDRPFVYTRDAGGARVANVEATYALSYGVSTSGAVRAIDVRGNGSGILQELGAQVGVTRAFALGAFGMVATTDIGGAPTEATGGAYMRLTLTQPDEGSDGTTVGLMLSGLREFDNVFSMSLHAQLMYKLDRFRVGGNLQAERRFTSTADGIDLIVRVGANYAVLDELRLGVEYIGQDLEDLIEEEEAEGGAAHLFALSITSELDDKRLHLGFAPGIVVASGATGLGGRAMVSYIF